MKLDNLFFDKLHQLPNVWIVLEIRSRLEMSEHLGDEVVDGNNEVKQLQLQRIEGRQSCLQQSTSHEGLLEIGSLPIFVVN